MKNCEKLYFRSDFFLQGPARRFFIFEETTRRFVFTGTAWWRRGRGCGRRRGRGAVVAAAAAAAAILLSSDNTDYKTYHYYT